MTDELTETGRQILDQINPDDDAAADRAYRAYRRLQDRATETAALVARFGGSPELKAHAAELQQAAREVYAAYRVVSA